MIVYKINVMQALKDSGYNPQRIRDEKVMSEVSLQAIRHNKMVGLKTIDALCRVLDLSVGSIITYVPDEVAEKIKQSE